MSNKEKYIQFCSDKNNEVKIPVFAQPFWLDAVAENWDVVLVETDNKIVGALPYCIKGKFITQRIYLPTLSFYQSFIVLDNLSKTETNKIIIRLFEQLPATVKSYFKLLPQYASISLENAGYTKENYTTYVLNNNKTAESSLRKNHQRSIEKAIKSNYRIAGSIDMNDSYALLVSTFKRQRQKLPIELDKFKGLVTILVKKNAGHILDCLDASGTLMASILIVKDKTSVYYLLGGYNENYKNSGAMTYLLWHCIHESKIENLSFNFCGSSKKSIANYFTGFGAERQPVSVWKKSLLS